MTLQRIRNQLEPVEGLEISEKGSGKGKFLYIRSPSRAIEVYVEDSGYFIEYWDNADEESDDAPVNRDVVVLESEAVVKIKNWLCVGSNPNET